ncbi:MAG: DNA gyrase subunit A, partial [Clostridia bacterium]|nr:DNA gyrase subunit A [Clostridia bacterium]
MATSIPPHNLREVIDGVILMIEKPEATVEELMTVIKGPDFPTRGTILGVSGIRDAYRTGRGRIVVRANTDIEPMKNNRQRIIVRDLPYMVNKARLIERIAELAKDKKVEGISDIRDESDRNDAVRIVIELKKEANASVVLNQLYKNTQLQDAFNANMLALVPDELGRFEPKIVNLRESLTFYIEHQKEVTSRRIRFDLEKAEARRHIVEGLRIAIDHIDEVIAIIRSSRSEDQAKERLVERFGFSDKQAQHIVDMRLGRLTGLEREKLENEFRDLCEKIDYLQSLLAEETLLLEVIKDDLLDVARRFGDDRRTAIESTGDDEIDDESLIQEASIVVTLTHFGYVKRMPVDTYNIQHRGGRGVTGMATREEDFVQTILTTSTHAMLLFFTNKGKSYRLKGYQIPEAGRQAKGMAIVNLLALDSDEKIRAVIPIQSFDQGGCLMMATKSGVVKKTDLVEYSNMNRNGLIAISLREDDELIGVQLTESHNDIVLVTREGMSIRFADDDVRGTGRNTQGVRGIALDAGDEVVGMAPTEPGKTILVVSERGFGKRTELEEYRTQTRAGKGLITYKPSEKTGSLAGIALVDDSNDLILVSDTGIIIRMSAAEIPILSRNTQGVRMMRTGEGKVVDLAVVGHEEPGEDVTEEELPLAEGEEGETSDATVESATGETSSEAPGAETPEQT